MFLWAYSVINLFRNVLLQIQEGTSIDIPWLWNRTDKLHYFDRVGFFRRRSEKKKERTEVLLKLIVFHDSSNLSYTLYFTVEPR